MTQRHQQARPAAAPAPDAELVKRLVREVQERLRRAATERAAAEAKRSYGTDVPCYGVTPAEVQNIGMHMIRQMRTGGLSLAMEVTEPLWLSGVLEEGQVAAQIVGAMKRHIGGDQFERFAKWAGALTNSANVDGLAMHAVCYALAAKPSLVKVMREWVASSNPHYRRAAVVSFVPMVREGRFLTDAFSVVEQVMTDEDPQVQEGAGLLLREASRLQQERVNEFLQLWKDKSPRQLLARATEKLSPTQRSEVLGG